MNPELLKSTKRKVTENYEMERFSTYSISFDPLPNQYLPVEIEHDSERLYWLAVKNPVDAVPELENLLEEYPNNPMLLNWLSYAYQNLDKTEEFESLTFQNYQANPDYLFARCNYAMLLMIHKQEIDAIPKIFNNKYDLKELYPDRDVFHLVEAITFCNVMSIYFAYKHQFETAELYLTMIKSLDPKNTAISIIENHIFVESMKAGINSVKNRTQHTQKK